VQVVYLPDFYTLVLFFLLWPAFQVGALMICQMIRPVCFSQNAVLFRCRKWENGGKIYQQIFKVRKWKKYLPESGALLIGTYTKRRLLNLTEDDLRRLVTESCRTELSHYLAITPFWVFGFFAPPRIILFMLLYSLIVNLPCIITQRYNRPRIVRMQKEWGV